MNPFKKSEIFLKKRRSGSDQATVIDTREHLCKNCKTHFTGNYCYNCGQNSNTKRISWKNFFDNLFGGLTNITKGFWFTMIELFSRPGHMINDFLEGKRVIYEKPFQMMLILAAIYAISFELIYPDPVNEEGKKISNGLVTFEIKEKDSTIKGNNTAVFVQDSCLTSETDPDDFNKKFVAIKERGEKLLSDHPHIKAVCNLLYKGFSSNKALFAILFIPFTALGIQLCFRKSRRNPRLNYVETFFTSMYLECQNFTVLILLLPFYSETTIAYFFCEVILSVWTFKGLFGNSLLNTILRYILSYLIIIGLLFLIILLLLIGLFLIEQTGEYGEKLIPQFYIINP